MNKINRYHWICVIVILVLFPGLLFLIDTYSPTKPRLLAFILFGIGAANSLVVTIVHWIAAVKHFKKYGREEY